ncbi:hypothetical protein D210916BOD24_32250 [Alteromonas sp. D210916BOD_24]|uniref:hypothetical protein n=1 Tax=Alteromonas sp. D210916BOD_24 TaxID=3157618 RepID=UPI00399D3C29
MENPKIKALVFNFEVHRVWTLESEKLPCYQIKSTDEIKVTSDNFLFNQEFNVTGCSEIELTPSENKKVFKGTFNEPQIKCDKFDNWIEAYEEKQKIERIPSGITLLMAEFFNRNRLHALIRPIGSYLQAEVIVTPLYCILEPNSQIQTNRSNQNPQNILSFQRSNW